MDRCSDYATPGSTIKILDRFGLSPKKSFGQNFLINDAIVRKILELSDVCDADCVLEIGPGIGTLTNALLKRAQKVTAIEKDISLLDVLDFTVSRSGFDFALINKDALDVEASDLGSPFPNKLIANLPYSVAATVVLDYFERFGFMESATVMVQKEVAERMMAKPGTKNYGAYSVKLSMFASPVGCFLVSPENFMPKPHVESTVIRLDRCRISVDGGVVDEQTIKAACLMADASFASRRKTIMNSCKTYFSGRNVFSDAPQNALTEIFKRAGIDSSVRGETLRREDYIDLGKAYLEKTSK